MDILEFSEHEISHALGLTWCRASLVVPSKRSAFGIAHTDTAKTECGKLCAIVIFDDGRCAVGVFDGGNMVGLSGCYQHIVC
jgi:hypothetical protein